MPDHTSVRKSRMSSQNLDGQHCHTLLIALMWRPSDCHLFGKLKEFLRGTTFEDDDAFIAATKRWLRRAGPEFYRAGIEALVPRWRKAVERDEDYVEE
jgi:hypothetical protein